MQKNPMIAVLVEDLFFRSKIEETARQLKIDIVASDGAGQASLVVLDLMHKGLDPVAWLRQWKSDARTRRVPVLGFLSHVQVTLKQQAVDAGCDLVVPRSVFSAQLPQLLIRYAKARLPQPQSA